MVLMWSLPQLKNTNSVFWTWQKLLMLYLCNEFRPLLTSTPFSPSLHSLCITPIPANAYSMDIKQCYNLRIVKNSVPLWEKYSIMSLWRHQKWTKTYKTIDPSLIPQAFLQIWQIHFLLRLHNTHFSWWTLLQCQEKKQRI